jgi:hypothetical protein
MQWLQISQLAPHQQKRRAMVKRNKELSIQQLWVAAERARSVVVLAEDDEEPEMADTKALRVVLATKGSVAKQMRERARQKQAQNQVITRLLRFVTNSSGSDGPKLNRDGMNN